MKRKRYLYHVTEPKNVEGILRDGLRRSMGNRTTCAAYLSEKPLSWYRPGLEVLRVDVSGLAEMKATTFLPDSDEVLFWGDIPAWKMTKDGWQPRINIVTDMVIKSKREAFS